ncbi:MAG TPA: cysteine synthase A [Armatimonadota bacterium]|nr:cysteine synthase A [Armatimonadota bacterium]
MTAPIVNNILDLIGNTPMVRLNALCPPATHAEVLAKLELLNPGGSVKDRIALAMIEDAEARGLLHPGGTVVESTSGNTGIGLAMVCAARGYRCIIVMPDNASAERRVLLELFGAEVLLTPANEGMMGAKTAAARVCETTPNCILTEQFSNASNPEAHRRATAREILAQTEGQLDAVVLTVGTGGTLTGVGEVLKAEAPGCQVVAVEPAVSAVLSGGAPGITRILGIGAGFVPAVLNTAVIDRVVTVTDEDAWAMTKRLMREEGINAGISSGAAVWAAEQLARELGPGQRVVTLLPDTGNRYLSMVAFFER